MELVIISKQTFSPVRCTAVKVFSSPLDNINIIYLYVHTPALANDDLKESLPQVIRFLLSDAGDKHIIKSLGAIHRLPWQCS